MRVGVGLVRDVPDGTPGHVAGCARLAEELGFPDLWISDHPSFPVAMPDPVVAAAVAGTATSTIGICLGIVQLGLRQPTALAKGLTSLHAELGRRLLVGLAVGGDHTPEWRALGVDPGERGPRFIEALPLLLRLLQGDSVKHEGKHFEFETEPLSPRGEGRPTVWVGARPGPPALRSLEVDGWLAMFRKPTSLRADIASLADAAADRGLPVPNVGIALTGTLDSGAAGQEVVVRHFARAYGAGRTDALHAAVVGIDDLVDRLHAYREAGVSRVMYHGLDRYDASWQRLAERLRSEGLLV